MTFSIKLDTANAIAQDAGTKFVRSTEDASWATKRALPIWQATDIERRLTEAGIEASTAPDNDDRAFAWVYATLDEDESASTGLELAIEVVRVSVLLTLSDAARSDSLSDIIGVHRSVLQARIGPWTDADERDALRILYCACEAVIDGEADEDDVIKYMRTTLDETDDVVHGLTFTAWLAKAGRTDSASEYDIRAAWRAGEDPAEYVK